MPFCACELKAVVWKKPIMKVDTLKIAYSLFLLEFKNKTKLKNSTFQISSSTYCIRIYFTYIILKLFWQIISVFNIYAAFVIFQAINMY